MTKMMVKNLSARTTEEHLSSVFSEFGGVRSVSLVKDVMTGQCRGFGFVHLDEQQSGAALGELNRRYIDNQILQVTIEQKENTKALSSGADMSLHK